MKRLTVRCPDEIYTQLLNAAQQHYRSTHGEILAIMNEALVRPEDKEKKRLRELQKAK